DFVAAQRAAGRDEPGEREFAAMRRRLAEIKDAVIADLPRYLDQFMAAGPANGVAGYLASDAAHAKRYVRELCQAGGVRTVVKSKSMVSEETNLGWALESAGIRSVETDLGEWIVQLDHERPSHMVMPAIHKSRDQVARLFDAVTGRD